MAITLIVNNIPFEYPTQGEQAPWGEAASGWAQEVTTVLSSLKGPSDILETSASIANGQTDQPVVGMFFDPTEVRSFTVQGNIYRTITDASTDPDTIYSFYEQFTLTGLNIGSSFILQQEGMGESHVTFDIDSSGQIKYTSSNLATGIPSPVNYSGIIKFRGIGILQT